MMIPDYDETKYLMQVNIVDGKGIKKTFGSYLNGAITKIGDENNGKIVSFEIEHQENIATILYLIPIERHQND